MSRTVATRTMRGTTQAWRHALPMTAQALESSGYVRRAGSEFTPAADEADEARCSTAKGMYAAGQRCGHVAPDGHVCGVKLFRTDSLRWARCAAHHPTCDRCGRSPMRRLCRGLCEHCYKQAYTRRRLLERLGGVR